MIQAALDYIQDLTGLRGESADIVLMIVGVYALATLASAIGEVFRVQVKAKV